jgi:hypothetical protein
VDHLRDSQAAGELAGLIENAQELELATDPTFNQLYMEHMFFE